MSPDTSSLPKPAQRILRAATSLFSRKGLAGTTTRMIAAKARMNEALIYRYFPTKRHLYAAILQCQMAGKSVIEGFDEGSSDLEVILQTIAARLLFKIRRDPRFLRLLYFSGLEGHKLGCTFYEGSMHRLGGFIATRFEAAIDRGEMRSMDTHLAARSFIGMVIHHALASEVFHFDAKRWPDEELVSTFTSIFLNGLRKPSAKKRASSRKTTQTVPS